MMVFRTLWLMYYLITGGVLTDSIYYPLLVCIGLMELSLCPLMYRTLHTDTQYWRCGGLNASAASLGGPSHVAKGILNKLEVGLLSDTTDAVSPPLILLKVCCAALF